MLKTVDEQVAATLEMAGFCFFYASRWLKNYRCPEMALSEALSRHTPLLFHGLGYSKKEEWQNIELCRNIINSADELSGLAPDEFEKTMLERFQTDIAGCAAELYPRSRGVYTPPTWNCGSLKYDPPSGETPDRCMIHIFNTVAPSSLFENPDYLISCFKVLLYETSMRYGVGKIGCSSWLNEEPRWLSFFPEEWHNNLTPRKVDALPNMTVGSWGFLYNAKGCFNRKYGDMIRRSGVLPFYPRTSFCSHTSMFEHLEKLSSEISAKGSI